MEFEWTDSYIEKLQSFVQTINSRVNRVTKLAPNKITRKHLPALVSSIANSSMKLVQKPKFYVGDYVRIAKADFRKSYKQIFTDKVFKIVAIPIVNPPTYSLIDAEKEEISGKFYEKELSLIGNKADITKMDSDEFTVHLISTASMDYFPDNTLASFRNFCKEELALTEIGELLSPQN